MAHKNLTEQSNNFQEEWKIIADFPNYEISNTGKVRSLINHWRLYVGKEITQHPDVSGYPHVHLRQNNKTYRRPIARLVGLAFLPPPQPDQTQINHIDNNPINNNLTNLEWCTPQENTDHKVRQNRQAKGNKISCAKLSPEKVLTIHEMRMKGISQRQIALTFEVTDQIIYSIIYRKTWKHITTNLPTNYPPSINAKKS